MRYASGLAVLALLLVSCGGPAPEAASPTLPAQPPSVVFGPADAPTGGTLVVGHLVPLGPSPRLVDLIGEDAYARFLDAEAMLEAGEAPVDEIEEEVVVEESGWALGREIWDARSRFRDAVKNAVREATNVEVLFRDVLATECDDLPVVIAEERELHDRELVALEPFFSRGGEIERVVPKRNEPGSRQPLVDVLIEAIRTSPAVHRLAEDPLAVVEARREGDDVLVRTAGDLQRSGLVSIEGERVAEGRHEPDGWMRVAASEWTHDPHAHHVVLEYEADGLHLRRGYTVAELVGVTERRILAHDRAVAGAPFAPHVLFFNDRTKAPVAGAPATLRIVRGETALVEAEGRSSEAGGLDLALRVPADTEPGPADLVVGETRFPIKITRPVAVSAVTDRPIYRPNDRIHARIMVHDTVRGAPIADEEVTLKLGSVEKKVRTSDHGIASAVFRLVDAKPGRTKVEATVAGARGKREVRVWAFELATYTVQMEPERLRLGEGDQAPVDVVCRYVNGEPVVGATVYVWSDTSGFEADARKRKTDAQGRASFVVRRTGQRPSGTMRVQVTDADGRRKLAELEIEAPPADPHALALHPLEDPLQGLPGRLGVHGAPGETVEVRMGAQREQVTLDDTGRGEVRLTPVKPDVQVVLQGKGDRTATRSMRATPIEPDQPTVRVDRRTAKVGEALRLRLGGGAGPVTLEVARGGTSLLSRTLLLGEDELVHDLVLDEDLAGVLTLTALRPLRSGHEGTSVRVLVTRGRALAVTAETQVDAYRPAETAHVDVRVRDAAGRPTAAVLGYWGVDEAVLAIAPWPDGQEDVFDLAGGRHALAARVERGAPTSYDAASTALGTTAVKTRKNSGRHAIDHRLSVARRLEAKEARGAATKARRDEARAAWLEAYHQVPLEALRTASSMRESIAFVVERGDLDPTHLLDPWGTPFAMGHGEHQLRWDRWRDSRSWAWSEWYGCPLFSAGPDCVFGTKDDVRLVWEFAYGYELEGRLGRFLAYVEDVLREKLDDSDGETALLSSLGAYTPFFGPAMNRLIGLGGGAGGAFRGRGGRRDLGGGGGGKRGSWPADVHVRRDFEPTLCFVPEAVVGPDGRTRLEIPLRDSITTWRLRLVASAADGATGIGKGSIRVTQPLHANPWVATHLTVGDHLEVPVSIRNETDETFDAEVLASIQGGVELVGDETRTLSIPPHGTGAAVFAMRAVRPTDARVRIDVRAGEHADAIERVVHVRHDARDETETWHATLDGARAWRPDLPTDSREHPTEYRLRVYTSPMATVIGGLDGLLTCPHG